MKRRIQNCSSWHPLALMRLQPLTQALLACIVMLMYCSTTSLADDCKIPRFLRENPSVINREWLRADFFLRAHFGDQTNDVSEIVESASARGFDVIAVVDDQTLKGRSQDEAYATAIVHARQTYPEMVILSGLHFKISQNGNEHDLTILMPADPDEFRILREFKSQFCKSNELSDSSDQVQQGLRWLTEQTSSASKPVVLANSTRWSGESSGEIIKSLASLRRNNALVVGFPVFAPLEDRDSLETTEQRLRADGVRESAWDQLLIRGIDVHSAFSHSWIQEQNAEQSSENLAETWVSVPKNTVLEKTAEEVIDALWHGAFFASRGGIVRDVRFSVSTVGLYRKVVPGEAVILEIGTSVRIMLECEVPDQDLAGNSNWLDNIEFTSISHSGTEKFSEDSLQSGTARFEWTTTVPEGGMVLRASGHRAGEGNDKLHFYTNSIRIRTAPSTKIWSASDVLSLTFLYPILKYLAVVIIGLVVFLYSLRRSSRRKRRRRSLPSDLAPRPLSAQPLEKSDTTESPEVDWQPPVVREVSSVQEVHGKKIEAVQFAPLSKNFSIPTRSHFAVGAIFFTAFAVYGLYVPLNYEEIPWNNALKEFSDVPFLQIGVQRRQDWVANILLFVPLGYLWCAALTLDTRNLFVKIVFAALTTIALSGLAVATEFFQIWFPPRTVSQNDIIAESLGALIGSTLSLLTVQWIVIWFRRALAQATAKAVFDWGVRVYLVALLLATLMPFDFVLNANEFQMKTEAGRLSMEFPEISALSLANLMATILVFIPVGIWVARSSHSRRSTALWGEIAVSIGIVAAFELIQIPVFSRYATLSGFLAGTVGATAGVFVVRFLGESVVRALLAAPQQNFSRSLKSLFLGVTYILVLAYFYVGPNNLDSVGETIRRLQDFWQVPFARLYWGTELNAFFVIARQLTLLLPLGFLFSDFVLARGAEHKMIFRMTICVVIIACIATLMEIGQIWNVDRYSDVTDALLLAIGGLGGLVLRASLADWSTYGFAIQKKRLVTLNRVLALVLLGAISSLGTGLASFRVVHAVLGYSRPLERRIDLVIEDEATSSRLRVQRVIVPTLDITEVIWGATGSDQDGNIWFGVSGDSKQFTSARVYQISTSQGWLTEVGSVLPELEKQGLLRKGESQQKIHSKFVEAEDGYLYFTSMDEKGEAGDGSQLPTWGSHLWRIHPAHPEFEHLATVPEDLIAVSGGGEWIYCLGLFDHILYQWSVQAKELKKVRVGSVGEHISRNFLTDHRGHAFVPRVTYFGDPLISPDNPLGKTPNIDVELIEYNTMLQEIGRTPLENYLTDSYWTSHGIVGFSNLNDNSIVFSTSQGFLYRILPQSAEAAAQVLSLGWIHPDGSAYAPSLFELSGGRSVGSVVKRGDEFEWVEFDLNSHRSTVFPFPVPPSIASSKDLLLYGSQTRDQFGAFYVVGRVHSTPVMLRIEMR